MTVFRSAKFSRRYKKLSRDIKLLAESRDDLFRQNPFDQTLETHKLHGKDKEFWAYSINRKYRIKFLFLSGGDVLYTDVGTHDEVY